MLTPSFHYLDAVTVSSDNISRLLLLLC